MPESVNKVNSMNLVLDRFQFVKTRRDQKWTVGKPGNKAKLQRMHCKSSSPSILSWFPSACAKLYLKR